MKFYVLYRFTLDVCSDKEFSNPCYEAESKEEVYKNFKEICCTVLQCTELLDYEQEEYQ